MQRCNKFMSQSSHNAISLGDESVHEITGNIYCQALTISKLANAMWRASKSSFSDSMEVGDWEKSGGGD